MSKDEKHLTETLRVKESRWDKLGETETMEREIEFVVKVYKLCQ